MADFGGDGPDDVLWWAPGPPNDTLWFGRPTLRFTSRPTTVDLAYARAAAIRPEALADQYNPYGFVAHAFGLIEGHAYTNSLEAFQRNYARGFRVFECDQVLLADGTVLVAHDGLEANYGLNKPFPQATWADLAGHRYKNRYTILRSDDVLQLLVDHPDVYIIPDPKYARPDIYRAYVRKAAQMGRSTCWNGSSRTSPTRPSWTPSASITRCRTTSSPCITARPRTSWTTRPSSTSCAATGHRP